jgi:hypothetical protein
MEVLDLYFDLVTAQVKDARQALEGYTDLEALSQAARCVSDTAAHLSDVESRLTDECAEWGAALEALAGRLLIEAAVLEHAADVVATGERASGP